MSDVKFPHISIKITKQDQVNFVLVDKVVVAMMKGGVSIEDQLKFKKAAFDAQYKSLLDVTCEWVTVD